MKEHIDYLSTLFVGIDIASRIHVISALDFNQDFFIKMKPFDNTKEGAGIVEKMIADVLADHHQFKYVVIGMESIGFYGVTALILKKLRTIRSPLTISEKMTVLIPL